jgi:hypothetical protein
MSATVEQQLVHEMRMIGVRAMPLPREVCRENQGRGYS